MTANTSGVAERLLPLAEQFLGTSLPVRLRAWDNSVAGPKTAPTVVLRSPSALRRLLWAPGELGLAQAYVTGELDVEGDLGESLRSVWNAVRAQSRQQGGPSAMDRLKAIRTAAELGVLGRRPKPPASQAHLRGALHSRARDRAVIHHHYDLSNDFYALLLDETMAYSSGYWTTTDPGHDPTRAQGDKLELICRKLALRPDARLLDLGCGWGSLTLHAAQHHGTRVTAVTLAAEQAAYVSTRVKERGLDDRVDVLHADYRDVDTSAYDAVAGIEMGEHVGDTAYPAFATLLHERVRPGGRVLLQQMSRGAAAPGGGAFIESFIAPDMHMRPLGETVTLLEGAGLEVRHTESLRTHYAHTIAAWSRTLEDRWQQFTALVGEETARVWRLYLAGSRLAFEERRMGVNQILAVRPGHDAKPDTADLPASWYGRQTPVPATPGTPPAAEG